MPTYRPRHICKLTVPIFGSNRDKAVQAHGTDVQEVEVRVRKAELVQNDHNHADELNLTCEWRDTGIDPRLLGNATVRYWAGSGDESGNFSPSDANLRFLGIAIDVRREGGEDIGMAVTIRAQDYTKLFLDMNPYPSDSYPTYSMSLRDAWNTICDNVGFANPDDGSVTSNVAQLKNRITFLGLNESSAALRTSVPDRFVRFGASLQPSATQEDAWAVWQRCVNSLGLISFIRRDQLVVTTHTNYFSAGNEPKLVWGQNIHGMSETRNTQFSGKGVLIRSFNPLTATTLEAYFPDATSKFVKQKKVNAKTKHPTPPEATLDSRYEVFDYPALSSQTNANELARRVWEERSRQELEGQIMTSEMFLEDINGAQFDVYDLASGDTISVNFDQRDKELLKDYPSDSDRLTYLLNRGYTSDIANLLIRNLDAFDSLRPVFYVRKTSILLETSESGGDFQVEIDYVNRIQVDGSTDDPP